MQVQAPSPDSQNKYEGDAVWKWEDQGEIIQLWFDRWIAIHCADMLYCSASPLLTMSDYGQQ